jgi:ketopantoate reductase
MQITIIGFGEAGQIYAHDLASVAQVRVWDKNSAGSRLLACGMWLSSLACSRRIPLLKHWMAQTG